MDANRFSSGRFPTITGRSTILADAANLGIAISSFVLLLIFSCRLVFAADIPLKLERFDGPDPSFINAPGNVIELHSSNAVRASPETTAGDGNWVLEMEYFCLGGVESVTINLGPPFDIQAARSLPALGNSEVWSPYVARLNSTEKPMVAGWKELRIELQLKPDHVLQIRNARLRLERPGEFDSIVRSVANSAEASALEDYLGKKFNSEISNIEVGPDEIIIQGKADGHRENLFLADIPIEYLVGAKKRYESLTPIAPDASGAFVVNLPRLTLRDGQKYDRLTSRWQVVHHTDANDEVMTHARYADRVACRSPQLAPAKLTSKKGLGGWSSNRTPELQDELRELGISAVTVNVLGMHHFVSLTQQPNTTPFTWQGRTYYAHEDRLARYDQNFREAKKQGAMVSAILLISNPSDSNDPKVRLLAHPDAVKEGKFAMPNITSTEGVAYYGAILNFLTERWSRDDGVHGRVHHWIVHNEIDYGWFWTNAGEKPDIVYMDLYQRSMRMVHLIARQYDPNARAFITLTHHWAQSGGKHGYGSKRMLELLLRYCRAEGDFAWGLAYHPYPQSLFNPRTWEDKQATFDLNSPKITPNNLEVLDAYMKLPDLRFHGEVRPVHLSENGFNSKDYSAKNLEDQAAGMALAWKKMAKLSSIESWQYHNWIDNRGEGGLRIGLRRFRDDTEAPLGKKPIWHLYQALGTPQEDTAAEAYLKTIGITSWEEVIYHGRIQ